MILDETMLRIRLPPESSPPKQITSWLDHDLVVARRPDVSRSSSAAIALGNDRVVVEGVTEHHIHEHGGEPARILGMEVRVFNPTKRALKVRVTGVDWLADHNCGVPQEKKPAPSVTGFHPQVLPPGTSKLSVAFTPRDAYQAHCGIFASRARLEIDGVPVSVISEHEVTREERLRD